MVTLSYGWAEMPFYVTSGNTYTELQGFTRKFKSICLTSMRISCTIN
ncbi:hypothetical protein [Escherichia phage BEK6]|nr:hypothetical protein [Escherichia phage BEK6]